MLQGVDKGSEKKKNLCCMLCLCVRVQGVLYVYIFYHGQRTGERGQMKPSTPDQVLLVLCHSLQWINSSQPFREELLLLFGEGIEGNLFDILNGGWR